MNRIEDNNTFNLEGPSLSLCVYEITYDMKFKCILEDDDYVPTPWGAYTKEIMLLPNENGYLFLCVNFDEGSEGVFKFTLNCFGEVLSITPSTKLMKMKYEYSIAGSWTRDCAGGCITDTKFYLNR